MLEDLPTENSSTLNQQIRGIGELVEDANCLTNKNYS